MKKLLFLVVAAIAMMATQAGAAVSTVTFNGGDIVAGATLNTGAPAAGDGSVKYGGTLSRTYMNTTELSAFNAWIASLGTGEGISKFSLWLQDGASTQAADWGETIALTNAYSPAITPFASSGWTASLYTVGLEWGAAWTGRQLITYTADSSADYLRSGTTDTFGFTADIYGIGGAGPSYVMWVGADADGIVGTGTNTDPTNLFQRAITATSVPEPATMLLLGLGLMGVAGIRRKFKG